MERKTTIKNIQRINKASDQSTTTSEHGGTEKEQAEHIALIAKKILNNTKREYSFSVRPMAVIALLYVRYKLSQGPVIGIIERKD